LNYAGLSVDNLKESLTSLIRILAGFRVSEDELEVFLGNCYVYLLCALH
jgi:hypothetical protein